MKYVYFVRGEAHARLAATSIESVLKADPAAGIEVYTDRLTNEIGPVLWDHAQVLWFDSGEAPIMIANLEAQCRALYNTREPVTFLDTDTLLLEPLPAYDADMAVTWRDHIGHDEEGNPIVGIAVTMPYNYGVIGVKPSYATLQAFLWMRDRIRRMSPKLQTWYGNQVALAALCGAAPLEGARTDERAIPWTPTSIGASLRIAKLPCERWNYTPQKVGERIHGTRSILHMKGGSRGLMKAYAERLNVRWHEAAA